MSFGKAGKRSAAAMESLAETYIGWLILSGQLGSDYLLTWNKENLNAYVQLTGPGALDLQYHSDMARLEFDRFKKEFGREPVCKVLDDGVPRKESRWKRGAVSLSLYACPGYNPTSLSRAIMGTMCPPISCRFPTR